MVYENIIIGGGASGLMLAANLNNKKSTLLIEHNSQLGAKIAISGGGRCNFTNKNISCSDYLADCNFIKNNIKKYNNKWLLKQFKNRGLEYSIKNNTEYFCKSSSSELLAILKREIKDVRTKLNCEVLSVLKESDIFEVTTNSGKFKAKNLIVASGGLSFAKIGASSIGYEIAKGFGHTIVDTKPALVGFTLQPSEAFFKELSGVSVEVAIRVEGKEFKGSMLFAHKGISGPVVLNASLFWEKGFLEIDFLPNLEIKELKSSTKMLSNLLPLPKRVAMALLKKLEIKDKNANRLSKEEWERLEILKSYRFAPAGNFGYTKAEVTKGGVDTFEVDSNSLMSKKVNNLFFIGEVLNVTGRLGGFNFQWAFSSAKACAEYLNRIIQNY